MNINKQPQLDSMTLEELRKYRAETYNKSIHTISQIASVAECLGEKVGNVYAKYRFKKGNIEIFSDCYGNYLEVKYKGKIVVSSHSSSRLFVPGPWESEIQVYIDEALQKMARQRDEEYESQRQKLIDELTCPE